MDKLHITGFDSAWGGTQKGAICEIWIDKLTGKAVMEMAPEAVTWHGAVERVARYAKFSHHIIAVDQGLIVPNNAGMRPVEKKLAEALGSMHCSAYPSNRSNISCFGENAGIWKFLEELQNKSYLHKPMSIPMSTTGRFIFECYPHPAIIAMLGRVKILKYKCRHRNIADWEILLGFLKSLPIEGLPQHLETLAPQNKENEDKLDAIVCAYIAVLWWQHGIEQSSMLGSMTSGYIITPRTPEMLIKLNRVFGEEVNNDESGIAPTIRQEVEDSSHSRGSSHISIADQKRPSTINTDDSEWSEPVELIATDTTNLSRNKKSERGPSIVINEWMNKFSDHRLFVKFLEEDGEPEVVFVPHSASPVQKSLTCERDGQQGKVWRLMVAGASKKSPLSFQIQYRYQPLD